MIKKFLLAVTPVYESLSPARCDLLSRVRELCRPEIMDPILDLITSTVNDDAVYVKKPMEMRNQRIYAVKVGTRSRQHPEGTF